MIKRMILGLLAFCAAVVCAAPVDEAMAKKAIGHWRTRRGTLDTRMGRDVSEVRRVSADGAEVHVVRFEGGGYAVAPTDTTLRPVILFSEDSDFDATPENPMWVLVKGELAARAASSAPARRLLSAAAPAASSLSVAERKNMGDWAELLEDAAPQYGLQNIDDVRVAPLTDNVTWWAQQGAGTGWEPFCYNYYTPSHHPCGCVATATAQVMRFFEWPAANAEIPVYTNPYCKVDGNWTELSTQGGPFDWSKMPVSPDRSATEEQRQAIGKLTSDLGILLSMNYKSEGSGSGVRRIPQVLTLLGYSNANFQASRKSYGDFGVNDNFQQILMSNLDAKLPVVLAIPGHAVVGDGYGYNGGTLYYHLNWGWGDYTSGNKAKTCWYSPANTDFGTEEFAFDAETNGFTEVAYNIYKTLDGAHSIASGRVLGVDGAPMSGVTVTAVNASTGAAVTNAVTDAKGIYALFVREGTYRLSVKTPAEDAGGGVQTRLIGSLSTNVFTNVSKYTYLVNDQGVPIHYGASGNESWITAPNPMMGNVAQCDIALRNERFLVITNGAALAKGTVYDCNVEVDAGATVSLDALPEDGGAAAVAAPGQTVTLKGNLTINLPSGVDAPGTYALISAGSVVVAPGATITVTGPNAMQLVCEATVTETAITFSITPNVLATTIWTGAVDGDPQNLGNWECRNAYGARLAPRLPTADTVVTLPDGCTNSFPAGNAFLAREVVLPATIGGDLDWSGITAPFTGTLDLRGKSLTVSQLTGDATITDTFPVEKYALLESIANANASQNWIDTGVMATPDMRAEYDLKWDDAISNVDKYVCGNDVNYRACAFVYYTPTRYVFRTGGNHVSGVTPTNTRRLIVIDMKNKQGRVYEADGTTLVTSVGFSPRDPSLYSLVSMYALSARTSTDDSTAPANFGKQTFYGVKFYENDVLTHDFVPAKRLSDGALGLLDMTNLETSGAFKAKKGTGTLTAGAATGAVIGGLLFVNVPQDETLTNSTVALTGNLRLVKTGAGTFTSTKTGQTYAGGTETRGGRFYDTASGDIQFGPGLSVTLDAPLTTAGTFTLNGDFTFNLSGWANAPGTYTLVSAGAVSVAPGATITVTGPNAMRVTWNVTTNAQTISVTLTGNNRRVTAQSYVQRSILAHWDAVDNQGTGSHVSTATTWKDRMNTARAFTLLGTSWQNGKALKFAGNANSYGYLDDSNSSDSAMPYTVATFGTVATKGVIEYAVNLTGSGPIVMQSTKNIAYHVYSTSTYGSAFRNTGTTTYNVGLSGNTTVAAVYGSSTLSGVYQNVASATQGKCGTKGSDNISGNTNGRGTVLGKRSTGNYFNGSIYALRLYSEQLSVEELAINYAIDRVRFYGETADVNTLLPAGWDVGDDGLLCHRIKSGALATTTWTDYNAQFDAGATITLSALPAAGASVLTVTGKKVALLGDLTFVLPSVGAAGTYTLVRADNITCPADANVTAVDPSGRFLIRNMTRTDGEITVELEIDTTSIMKATWTGAANDGNIQNPENWTCLNPNGETIPGIPQTHTVVTIPNGCTNNFPASSPLVVKEVKLPATLGADNLDWSGIAAPFSGTLDLQGRKLTVSQLSGTGTITDSSRLDYELLDTIRSTGTQCIRTGVNVTTTTELEIDFSNDTSGNNRAIFAMDVWALGGFLFTKQNGNYMFYGNPALTFVAADTSKKYRVKVGGGTVSLTDLTAGTAPVSRSQGVVIGTTVKNTELALFARNDVSYFGSYTFHRLWVKDGAGTEHTFVPVRQISTGKCGILDLEAYRANSATGFHGNAGTGDFTAGNVTNRLYKAGGTADTPGELHVNVVSGTQTNTGVTLIGALKFVKEGAGTFVASKTGQTYIGGTEVAAGLLSLPAGNTAATGCFGEASGAVQVDTGAILELNGNVGFKAYPLVLAGGTLRNGTVKSSNSADQLGTVGRITLEADSTEAITNNLTHTGLIDLNERTLTVRLGGSGQNYTLAESGTFTNGTVNIVSGGWFYNKGRALDMSTVNLKIGAAVNLGYDITVNNLELLYTANYGNGTGRFLIRGAYKAGNYHRNCVMLDGSTLDLGTRTGIWPLESTLAVCTPLAFADGATVTVKLGDRTVAVGDCLVSWTAANKPNATVMFRTDKTEAYADRDLEVRADGLYLVPHMAARATWTGNGNLQDVNDEANWDCWDSDGETMSGYPSIGTVVTLPNGCTNSFPVGGAFLAREVKLPATIGANLDWSGITAPLSGTLDLQGNTLTLSQLTGDATITDTTDLEYDLLDSIASDRFKGQYIKTGMTVADNVKYELDFGKYIYTKTVSNLMLLGLDSGNYYGFGLCQQNKNHLADNEEPWLLFSGPKTNDRYLLAWTEGHNYRLTVDAKDITTTGNGSVTLADTTPGSSATVTHANMTLLGTTEKMSSLAITSGVTNRELALFGRNNGGSCTSFTFYRFWFKEASGTEHTFVPVRQRSTGKYGILDLTTKTFRGNANTAATSGDFTPGAVTNYLLAAGATGTPGTLCVNVASGTAENTTVTVCGNLKLVKEGAGTFAASKAGQTYIGGTEVAAGTFQVAAADEKANRFAGVTGSGVTVDVGAALNLNGNPGFAAHPLVLAGGTVNASAAATSVLGAITLTANSTLNPGGGLSCAGDINLGAGGYTLTVNTPVGMYYDLAEGARFTGTGTVNVTSGGYIRFLGTAARDMSTVNLRLNCAVQVDADITVNDLELPYRFGNQYARGDGSIYIKGRFIPTSSTGYHRNCVMLDGSTLDLGTRTGIWPLEPDAPTSGTQMCTPVTFEDHATIAVRLDGRTVKSEQIVTWQNDPGKKVTFVLEPGVNARLVRKSDGLWLQTGFLLRIR